MGSDRPFVPLALAVTLAAGLLLTGCGGDGAADDAGPDVAITVTAAPTSAAPTTVDPTTAPPTTEAPPRSFPSPTDAGAALFGAWTRGDRAGAAGAAPAAELDRLFATSARPDAKNRGCDDGDFGSAACFFGNGQGGVNVTLAPAPAGGWVVTNIDPFG